MTFLLYLLSVKGEDSEIMSVLVLHVVPVLLVVITAILVIIFLQHAHKRRMRAYASAAAASALPLPHAMYRDELRATAAGDSTLRVSLLPRQCNLFFFLHK